MDNATILTLLVLAIGFYMAWNIGANDVSNAMGTSVGSGALTLRKAVMIAAVLEFSGAFFLGSHVSETMQKGLIHTQLFAEDPLILVLGMCAVLCGTGVWLQIASFFGWPVSTTHAIVGAILGFGGAVMGIDVIQSNVVNSVAASWIISPVLAGMISYFVFNMLQRNILYAMNPLEAARKFIPLLTFIVLSAFTLSLLFNGLTRLDWHFSFIQVLAIAFVIGSIASFFAFLLVRRVHSPNESSPISRYSPQTVISLEKALKHLQRVHVVSYDETHEQIGHLVEEVQSLSQQLRQETNFLERTSEYTSVEKMFGYLQILSASFVAFGHGANDVANAIGPVAAVLDIINRGVVSQAATVPSWLLVFGGLGIVTGLATWGWRVIATIGKKITELTPTRGFSAEFGTAITILLASKLGLPVSTTHCLVGAVLGVGLARGIRALNLRMLREIALSWVITLPASAITSVLIFYLLKAIFI